ncbi:unnamed protein product [Closterium sp. NIES-54]
MALDVTWGQGWALAGAGALLIALYCYIVVKPTRVGFPRLIVSVPALTANVFLPWIFRQEDQILGVVIVYCITTWLSSFKLLCFCWDTGVLSSPWISSDVYRFVAALSLPIHIQPISKDVSGKLGLGVAKQGVIGWISDTIQSETWTMLLIRSSFKLLVFYHLTKLMAYLDVAPLFLMHVVLSCNLFLFVTIVCETLAGVAAAFLDIKMLPHFNHPYFATSFQELWSRRWNLTVSTCLRETIFEPVKFAVMWCTTPRTVTSSSASEAESAAFAAAAAGTAAADRNNDLHPAEAQMSQIQNGEKQNGAIQNGGVHCSGAERNSQSKAPITESRLAKLVGMLATFFVSGLAHEMAVWYMSNRVTGEMTMFFTLHGIVSATECYIMRQRSGKGSQSRKAERSAPGGATHSGIASRNEARLKLWRWKDVAAWIFVVGSSLVSAHFLFFGPLTRLRLSHEVIREVRTAFGHFSQAGQGE